MTQKLNLPEYSFRIKKEEEKEYIFDDLRKKFVRLSPEEWVRQNFIAFLLKEKNYPRSLLAVEASVTINQNKLRADLIVYKRNGKPALVVEFKAPSVKISQLTFDQIVRYNMQLKVEFLVVSNGLNHYCCKIDYLKNSFTYLQEIPDYKLIES